MENRMTRPPTRQGAAASALAEEARHRLEQLRLALLRLHKVLLDDERAAYEKVRGRTSSYELLQLLIKDPQFAWLHAVSEMVVRADEILESDEPSADADAELLLKQARTLLVPAETGEEFARKYHGVLQRQPDAVLAHKDVTALLSKGA